MNKLLKQFRKRCNLTQVELAKRAGISLPCLVAFELGKTDIRVGTLTKILNVFGFKLVITDKRLVVEDRNEKGGKESK